MVNLLLGSLRDNTTGTDVIQIVEVLCCIALYFFGIDGIKCINRLLFESYIIIVGRVYDSIFGFGIQQQTFVALGKLVALFVDTLHGTVGHLTELVESTVVGAALTKAHLLNVSYQVLQLVIGCFDNIV